MDVHYLHQFFELKAKTNPDHLAVISDGKEISYAQLEKKANQLAFELKCLGVKPKQYIAILVERNDLAYIAMLAILKIGAAYVPLDPEFPTERINFILQDCAAHLILTTQALNKKEHSFACPIFLFDQILERQNNHLLLDRRDIDITPEDTCYVIYTSGSTGKPKGVEISHRNVHNYIQEINRIYHLQPQDRIYQGFSLAFDASVEEIWGAFSAGATLIPTHDKAIRSGAGLVEFLNKNRITVFSTIPTLLEMLDPPIESLRLLVLGGETCRHDAIKRWSRSGLRILNTYGPTEATVVTTFSECYPDKLITLGSPLNNCEICILNENLQPIGNNEEGELCISGAGLSRGYINRPDLNESKFIYHPDFNNKRFYRTGDLCRKLDNGEIQYLGRLDSQIKLRGYRIELSEIESVIREHPEVRQSVVSIWESSPGVEFLAAYIVPENNESFLKENIIGFLRQRLAPYMVPSFFETIDNIPLLPSGKINRKNLPPPQKNNLWPEHANSYSKPKTESEKKIVQIWEKLFNKNTISTNDHFFYDLGGHSLLAAKAASILRNESEFGHVSILDIYKNPTIEKLASSVSTNQIFRKADKFENTYENRKLMSTLKYYLCGLMQCLGIYFQFATTSLVFISILFVLSYFYHSYSSYSLPLIFASVGLLILSPFLLMGFVIAMKWLLLGRVKPGTYPLWGFFYLRWWLVQRIQHTVFSVAPLLGSPMMNVYCRLMGAKIGKNCFISSKYIYPIDVISIDDDSSINNEAALTAYIVKDGFLKIGSIHIGKRCFIGVRSVLDINTIMEDDASLEDLSMLPENNTIPKGKSYSGSPARQNENHKSHVNADILEPYHFLKNIKYGFLHYLGLLLIASIYLLAFLPGIFIMEYFYNKDQILTAILMGAPLAGTSFIILLLLGIFITKKLLIGNIKPGIYSIKSGFYVRKWITEHLINLAEVELLTESLFYPHYLRLLGTHIGKRVEMAETPYITPELLTIHDEGFTASSVIINSPRAHLGQVLYAPSMIGKRTFIGSGAVLIPNTELRDKCLLGSLTISPPRSISAKSPNSTWLGSPPVFLPQREINHDFSDKYTFNPTKWLYLLRATIELIRIITPVTFSFLFIFSSISILFYLISHHSFLFIVGIFPVLEMLILFILSLMTIGLKWILMGKYRPGKKPLWDVFIWKRDLIEHLHNYFLAKFVLEPIVGTPFLNSLLRLLGAKIGKRVYNDTLIGFAEHDLIEIGDDVSLNMRCTLLTHLYEDRIFKMNKIKIHHACHIGIFSIVSYDTVMEENTTLGHLSLLMKGEHLPGNSHWVGIPSQPS